ncbi:ankyrin repeat protein [Ancylostoma ceylanicum]|uniref:Ankyrin repeat protein n=1 Tax=Ancylostoma ceylanicum TaxID=53326 RepID=A0A0D6LG35_9BILA|nr:ankyrin repeat protein [Ancylostoma ceylanicum]
MIVLVWSELGGEEALKKKWKKERRGKLTALHYAAKFGNVDIAEFLLDMDASLEIPTTRDRFVPLHMVAKDVDVKDRYKMTPLDYAILKDNERAVLALLRNGANPNERDKNKRTPLLKACNFGSYKLVCLLLSFGADCSITDKWRNSAFHMVAAHGRNEILQLLIDHAGKHGVELLWTTNNEGKTPLELAVNGDHASTVNIILSMKPPGSDSATFRLDKFLLHEAAAKGYLEVVKILIQLQNQSSERTFPFKVL